MPRTRQLPASATAVEPRTCDLRLNLPRRAKRRVPHRPRRPLIPPPVLNQTWAIDFMADALYDRCLGFGS